MNFPLTKGIFAKQAHVALPENTFEEEHGRDGFYGPVTHLYRTHSPIAWTRIEGPLKPRAFDANKPKHTNWMPVKLFYNNDVAIYTVRPSEQPMTNFFRNADGEEVYFIHEGSGRLETDFGVLDYEKGDYLVIPRGTTYRFSPQTEKNFYLLIESFSRIKQPDRGLMGQHALYDPAVIKTPEPAPVLDKPKPGQEWEVCVKRLNEFTRIYYPFNPMDVIGWKGDLTVWQLNIRDIRPVLSPRYHLAPSVHSTFLADAFIICTFVPRPLEEDPEAVRVPFYHRNIDYDEVLFYHDGDFFSRDGIDAGMITLHPQGVHHGPHPKAVEGSEKKTHTDEVAVMVDTRNPLFVTPEAEAAEWKDYHLSWKQASFEKAHS